MVNILEDALYKGKIPIYKKLLQILMLQSKKSNLNTTYKLNEPRKRENFQSNSNFHRHNPGLICTIRNSNPKSTIYVHLSFQIL